jgi:hypothetical protein
VIATSPATAVAVHQLSWPGTSVTNSLPAPFGAAAGQSRATLSRLSSEPAPTCHIRSGVQYPSAAAWSAAVTPATRAGVSALAGAATAVVAASVTSTTASGANP